MTALGYNRKSKTVGPTKSVISKRRESKYFPRDFTIES